MDEKVTVRAHFRRVPGRKSRVRVSSYERRRKKTQTQEQTANLQAGVNEEERDV